MVDTNELESFLNERSGKDGDVCVILRDGEIEDKEDPISHRKYRLLNLPVEINGRELTWTPDKDAIAVFRLRYGSDSTQWIGKQFKLKFYPKTVFGQKKTAILPTLID